MSIHIRNDLLNDARRATGVSCRAHADAAGVTTNVLLRLSDTGDATHMSIVDLASIAAAVGLRIQDVLADGPSATPPRKTDVYTEVISALFDHKNGLAVGAICAMTGTSPDDADTLLTGITTALRALGLTVARDRDRVMLGSLPRSTITDDAIEKTQARFGRTQITTTDVRLVHRAYRGDLGAKILDNTKSDGYLRTRHLQRVGLLNERGRAGEKLTISDRVRYSLLTD